jgi:outer membrane protein assembly factor BamB
MEPPHGWTALSLRAAGWLAVSLVALASATGASVAAGPAWTTYRHDAARTGIDPDSGSPLPPKRAWRSAPLDGHIYAEPLVYGADVYVATENDTVYALDATTGKVAWEAHVGTPVPAAKLPCGNIKPTVGITGTPVIDPATRTLYAVADTWDGTHTSSVAHRLVALDVTTGAMRQGFPIPVDPPFPSGGSPLNQLQRAALALDGNEVVVGYGGNAGDCATYWGWLVGAPESGSGPLVSYQVDSQPGHHEGAIWGAGNGPPIDANGDVYAASGNGASGSAYDYGDSVLRLTPTLQLLEAWAPVEWQHLDEADTDLGSSEPVLLPGGHLFQIGKQGVGVLLRADALGGTGGKPVAELAVCVGAGSWGGGIYVPAATYAGTLYVTCSDGLHAISVSGLGGPEPTIGTASGWTIEANAVGPPIFAGGLVWVASWETGAGTLYGLDPHTGAVRFEEQLGTFMHFSTPSAGGGRLFVAADTEVTAFTIATAPAPEPSPTPEPLPTPTPQPAPPTPAHPPDSTPPPRPSSTSSPRPIVLWLRQAHALWREGDRTPRIGRASKRPPVGTEFTFALNERAMVTLRFTWDATGHHLGHACAAGGTANGRGLRCRGTTEWSLSLIARPGSHAIVFQGRMGRTLRLPLGRYTLTVIARNAAGASPPRTLSFRIVR